MRLSLGANSYDLTSRALVMGVVPDRANAGLAARDLVAAGADIVDLGCVDAASEPAERDRLLVRLSDAWATVDVPLCVGTVRPSVAAALAEAGAAMVDVGTAGDAALLEACASGGAVALVTVDDAHAVGDAGVDRAPVVLQTGDMNEVARLVSSGRPVVLRLTASCPVAAMAVGVIVGARVLRTSHALDARRVCDVLAAVREAG